MRLAQLRIIFHESQASTMQQTTRPRLASRAINRKERAYNRALCSRKQACPEFASQTVSNGPSLLTVPAFGPSSERIAVFNRLSDGSMKCQKGSCEFPICKGKADITHRATALGKLVESGSLMLADCAVGFRESCTKQVKENACLRPRARSLQGLGTEAAGLTNLLWSESESGIARSHPNSAISIPISP